MRSHDINKGKKTKEVPHARNEHQFVEITWWEKDTKKDTQKPNGDTQKHRDKSKHHQVLENAIKAK